MQPSETIKNQLFELKTILVLLAARMPSEAFDDTTLVLFYRAQSLADECSERHAAIESLSRFVQGGMT
jgi:hypothetical protein